MTPEGTRQRILDAALALFAERGFEGVSIRELASAVDLTTAALYYHFESKEACLEGLALPFLDEMEAVLDAHPPAATADVDGKRGLLSDYLTRLTANPRLARLMAYDPAVSQHPAIGPRIEAVVDGLLDRLAAPRRSKTARLRASAALGAIRRPILERGVEVVDENVLIEAAIGMLT